MALPSFAAAALAVLAATGPAPTTEVNPAAPSSGEGPGRPTVDEHAPDELCRVQRPPEPARPGVGGLGIRGKAPAAPTAAPGQNGMAPDPSRPTTVGRMDREALREVMRAHADEVRACYEQGLRAQPSLEGKLLVRWVIDDTGRAKLPCIVGASTTIQDREVWRCVMKQVTTWQFPKAEPEGFVRVTFPWSLRRSSAPAAP